MVVWSKPSLSASSYVWGQLSVICILHTYGCLVYGHSQYPTHKQQMWIKWTWVIMYISCDVSGKTNWLLPMPHPNPPPPTSHQTIKLEVYILLLCRCIPIFLPWTYLLSHHFFPSPHSMYDALVYKLVITSIAACFKGTVHSSSVTHPLSSYSNITALKHHLNYSHPNSLKTTFLLSPFIFTCVRVASRNRILGHSTIIEKMASVISANWTM